TVAIKWCNSDQRGNFTAVVVSQLPDLRQEISSPARPPTVHRARVRGVGQKFSWWFDVFFFEQVELFVVFFFFVGYGSVRYFDWSAIQPWHGSILHRARLILSHHQQMP